MNLILKTSSFLEKLNLDDSQIESHGLSYLLQKKDPRLLAHQLLRYRSLLQEMEMIINADRFIIIKGIALTDSLYQGKPLRPFSDLDLLIEDKDDFDKVEKFLSQKGFKSNPQDLMSKNKTVWGLKDIEQEVVVELHRSLLKNFTLSQKELQQNEMMFLYLVYHLVYQHNFLRLIWLCDLYLFIKTHPLDFVLLQKKAKQMGLEISLQMAFHALKKVFQHEQDEIKIKPFVKQLITSRFLKDPKGSFLYYLMVKTLNKGDLGEAASYYLHWIKNHFKKTSPVNKK